MIIIIIIIIIIIKDNKIAAREPIITTIISRFAKPGPAFRRRAGRRDVSSPSRLRVLVFSVETSPFYFSKPANFLLKTCRSISLFQMSRPCHQRGSKADYDPKIPPPPLSLSLSLSLSSSLSLSLSHKRLCLPIKATCRLGWGEVRWLSTSEEG